MAASFAHSQESIAPVVSPAEPIKVQAPADDRVPLIQQALKVSDFSGSDKMQPAPALAAQLGHIRGFVQNAPFDGKAPSEDTEVWLGRTASAITFAFICHDHHPDLIRTHLARRENILSDDTVSVLLDPLQDHRRGVLFSVNPSGVQADAAWNDSGDTDYSYDQIWDSDARMVPGGWIAVVTIPFRSLRFRAVSSDWGVVFTRKIPRLSERDFWPRIAANVSGVLTQEGTLHGVESTSRSHNLQLNPYGLLQNEHTLNGQIPLQPFFSNRHFEGTAGGDVKAILHDTVVVDATINPDFSQVESDQPQFTVNQRYPVHFPELRPFFLENANYFSTPISLVYTRNIVHPEAGARITGKLGQTNFGTLVIDDRQPGEVFAQGDPLRDKHALFAIARVSEDIGKGSSLGALYTDEEFAGGWNRVGGLDATIRFNDRWTGFAQAVESSTSSFSDLGSPTAYSAGPAFHAEVNRSGHSFNLDNTYEDFSTGFSSQVGFIQTANIRTDSSYAHYQWYPKSKLFQSIGIESNTGIAFDHQGNRVSHNLSGDPFFTFARQIVFAPLVGQSSDTLTPAEYPLLDRNRNFTENFVGLVLRGAPLAQLNFSFVYTHGGSPNFNPADGAIPSLLVHDQIQSSVTIDPFRSLTIDNTYLLDRDVTAQGGVDAFENQTLRTKINYQFTRAFSARVIAEYDSLLVNPLQTALVRTKQVSTQVLFTWLPHPGTAIYVGYNGDFQNLNDSLCNLRPGGGGCDPNNTAPPRSINYLNDGRQIFVKASYLLRF